MPMDIMRICRYMLLNIILFYYYDNCNYAEKIMVKRLCVIFIMLIYF